MDWRARVILKRNDNNVLVDGPGSKETWRIAQEAAHSLRKHGQEEHDDIDHRYGYEPD